ncbi:Unknown protein [Striga hermonthica]|uniref:KIB1-4 beta-propeller domain-containing protein n=1 Tax=Striga hermonthica TaxID=68872 RepID=A0A9N7MQD1_STRHE|nr:Unknown protein [Striga hermonthica]
MYPRFVLTGPPTDPDCHVIFCSGDELERTVFRVRDCTTVRSREVVIAAMTSFRGEMYGLVDTDDRGFEFVTVHVVNGGLKYRPLLDELGRTVKLMRGSYLEVGIEFKVLRVEVSYNRQVVCVELESVDEWTIFINSLGSSFCRTSQKGACRPNCVYYTDDYIGRTVKVYDLGKRCTTVLMPFRYAGRYVSLCYWVDIPDIPEPELEPQEVEHNPEPELELEPQEVEPEP